MPNIDEILGGAREAISVQRVFGEPYEADGVTVIPAALVRGGGGGGGDDDNNGGAGFAIQARPAGAYVIKEGEVQWKPALDPNRIMLGWQLLTGLSLLVALVFVRGRRS